MIKQPLHNHWTVSAVGDLSEVPSPLRGLAIPAQVPGCVHTDLLRAGKIPDPYLDQSEFAVQWIGLTDWQYRTTFDADPKLFDQERIDLVCDGLDTVARIELNGTLVAETQNMHRGYRFDVRKLLRKGPNELTITFASPVKYAHAMRERLGFRPYCNGPAGPFNFIRKMAANFGWDWGPALPTCGIWRPIRLEGWSKARIASVRPNFTSIVPGYEPALWVSVEIERTDPNDNDIYVDGELYFGTSMVEPSSDGGEARTSYELLFQDPNPKLWWPRGHGAQPLYDLLVHVKSHPFQTDRFEHHDSVACRIGLRTLELDTSPDDIGRKFVLKVNGKPIFCKGFNWIPDDCFLDRACEPTRVRQRIQQSVDAGGNMLRVWGGGIFETDDFYSICDEMGVLVWQDFLFACAMYPEEQPFWDEVEAEARYNVARLAHHPSLAVWNGCNENIWAYRDWGWKDDPSLKDKKLTWGKGYYFDLLPKVCKELTPSVPYWAGSPWSGDYDVENGVPPNAATHGNKHVWEAWFREDYAVYRTFEPRFCSEFGFQGPANYANIAKVVPPEARDFGSPEMRHRQKSGDQVRDDGDRRNLRHLIRHFNLPGAQELLDSLDSPDPKAKVPECGCGPLHAAKILPSEVNFDDLHYLLSVNQCRALTLGVEWFRSRQPTCMGTLYWQLNDCWPGGTTWSCLDEDGKPKLLWYATREFFADILGTFQPEPDGSLSFCIVNDTDESFGCPVSIVRTHFDGRQLAVQTARGAVAPRSVHRVRVEQNVATPNDATRELLWATHKRGRALWYFAPDRELNYPRADFKAEWDGAFLTISANTLLRDICILADRLEPEAQVDRQLVTMLGGETRRIRIESTRPLTLEQITSPKVLRCVNPFGRKS